MHRLALIAPLFLTAAAQAQPGFWLTHDPNGDMEGSVQAFSQDGSIAVGTSFGGSPYRAPGFSWTIAGGRDEFGLGRGLPTLTAAGAVSSDGGTIVGEMGESHPKDGYWMPHAYRRVGNGPLQDLGLVGNWPFARATGVSGDGQIVVGTCETNNHWQEIDGEPFRWTAQTGMIGLGHLKPGGDYTQVFGISRDGTTIVGTSRDYDAYKWATDAYRWTAQTGMVQLPSLPAIESTDVRAWAVNADGSVVVGWVHGTGAPNEVHPVRWVNGAVQELAELGKGYCTMGAVDDSGDVIGGQYWDLNGGGPQRAVVWTPATGLVFFQDYLASFGIYPPEGIVLADVFSISGDGRTFGGWTQINSGWRGFVATIPAPCNADCDHSGSLDIDDFICFQTLFGLGDAAADCDKSGGLDVDDFICFQTKFGLGCP